MLGASAQLGDKSWLPDKVTDLPDLPGNTLVSVLKISHPGKSLAFGQSQSLADLRTGTAVQQCPGLSPVGWNCVDSHHGLTVDTQHLDAAQPCKEGCRALGSYGHTGSLGTWGFQGGFRSLPTII